MQTAFPNRLAYLSGAPRVSTRVEAELTGARSHVLGVINAFQAISWEVQAFIAGDYVPSTWTSNGSGLALTRSRWHALAADVMRLILATRNAQRVRKEFANRPVHLVYERFASMQALGRTLQRRGAPWILETNALLFREAEKDRSSVFLAGLARRLELAAYRQCDILVCISDTLKNLIIELGVDARKIIVVPNGVDTQVYNPDHQSPRRHHSCFTVGFVGSLSAWQALDLLLEAVSELRKEGYDIAATIVGDGPVRSEWEQKARELGLESAVVFLGHVIPDEVPQHIAGFDVGYSGPVQLSVGEMYLSPLKLYEYMAMAKPVVAAAFEDAKRLIEGRDIGFLFKSADRQDLIRALRKAYERRDDLPAMGRRARAEIAANHSWVARVSQLMAQVEDLIELQR